jgi:hypothetical protein
VPKSSLLNIVSVLWTIIDLPLDEYREGFRRTSPPGELFPISE